MGGEHGLEGSWIGLARTEAQRMADDVCDIRVAIADEDLRTALRRVDRSLGMAPEARAIRSLPDYFPMDGWRLYN